MFGNAARPKAYIIMWIALHQRLAIVDRLAEWGVKVNKECTLCQETEETIEHPMCNVSLLATYGTYYFDPTSTILAT